MPSPNQNKTQHLKFGTECCNVAFTKTVDFCVRNAAAASFHVRICDNNPCAGTFADPDVCVGNNSYTITAHGFFTGLKGVFTIACDCNSVFNDCCVSLACDSITEACHGFCTGQAGVLSFTKGSAKAFPDECLSVACDQITETAHGYVEGERGQFSFTIGCSHTFNDCDVCLTCDTITNAGHGLTKGERVQLTIALGCAGTFIDGDVCLTCDTITICSHGWITSQKAQLTVACAACAFTFTDAEVSVANDTITVACNGLVKGTRGQITHTAGCAGTFRDGDIALCTDQITVTGHGWVTGTLVNYTITNSTCAKNFLEAGICLTCDQITSCAHGFSTGQKGQLSLSIGCAINALEADIIFACNKINEPCIALIEAQRVSLSICNGCPSTVLDECINICTDLFTDAGHGLLVNQRGQFTVTVGCAVGGITQNACNICLTCNTITAACHGLTDLERGQVTSTCALPAGLCACTNYFVIKVNCNTFSLATTRANAVCNTAINLTGLGSGTLTFTPNGALPAGLCAGTNYYLICVGACSYKVSASQGGAAVNITGLNGPASTIFTPNGILPAAINTCCNYFLKCVVAGACGSFKLSATSGGAVICLADNNGGIGTLTVTPNGILPTGVTTCTDYYIIKVDCNNFKLATTQANAVACTQIDLTAKNGGGTMTFTGTGAATTGLTATCCYYVIKVDCNTIQLATTEANALACTQIDLTALGGAANNSLDPTCAAIPTGLSTCTNYYVTAICGNSFKLASSAANAASCTPIDITALAGANTMTFTANGAVPTGVAACTNYFIIKVDCNTVKLATTEANAVACTAINLTALNGTPTATLTPNGAVPTGLSACTNYFATVITCCTYKLATNRANAMACTAINMTAIDGAGTMTITPNGSLPSGISACTNYYVIKVDCNNYKVASTRALAVAACPTPVTITAANAPATQTFTPNGDVPTGLCGCSTTYYAIRVDANTYKLATTNANALAGTAIDLTALNAAATMTFNPGGVVPTGLSACATYYIIRVDANTIKFATTAQNASDGVAIQIDATNGAGTMTFTPCTTTTGTLAFTGSIDGVAFATIPCGPATITLTCVLPCTAINQLVTTYANGGLGGINVLRLTLTLTEGQVISNIDAASNATS